MNIDNYIQHWAKQILKESDDTEVGLQSDIENYVAHELGSDALDLCRDILVDPKYLGGYYMPFYTFKPTEFDIEFGGMPMLRKIQDGYEHEDGDEKFEPSREFHTMLPPSEIAPEALKRFQKEFYNLIKDLANKKADVWESLEKQLKGKVKIKKASSGTCVLEPGTYEMELGSASFYGVRHGTLKITMKFSKPQIVDVVNNRLTDDTMYHRMMKTIKNRRYKPLLPRESKEEINEDEKQPGKIRMLFRTKEHIDDNAGEIVFDDISSMVKFIESVGGDYSAEIADGFTQGKLMTIDLKTPVIQLSIQQQNA